MNVNQTETNARPPGPSSSMRSGGGLTGIWTWFGCHPHIAIMVVSALAVIINCYPVIFCGRSFVSPSTIGGPIVYNQWPSLPGMPRMDPIYQHESDVGAMLYWDVPVSFIESRSILEHGEIPLWNRYGHAGDILLGQAVSMLGDPLQLIVIFGHASAVAWDIKFLVAKFLFCTGFGLLVLQLLKNQSLSLIFAALAAYSGAYMYIDNHPVFFVFAYAPWILVSAIEMLTRPLTGCFRWGVVWLVASTGCFNGGHVEVAVALIGGLNLAALVFSLMSRRENPNRITVLARMAGATLLFLGLNAPVWITFLTSLPNTYSTHTEINVRQIPLASFPGIFDDVFYHLFPDYFPIRTAPGTSLLILTGCIFSILRWRTLSRDIFFRVNLGAIIFWTAFVFDIAPKSIMAAVPLLNHVGHVQTDFSYLLVIHLTLQCAFGFKSLLRQETFWSAAKDCLLALAVIETMLVVFCFVNLKWVEVWIWLSHYLNLVIAGAVGAPLLYKYLTCRHGQVRLLGWIGIVILGFLPNCRFGLYLDGNEHLFMIPGRRAVLNAPSAGLAKIKSTDNPFRIVGMDGNLGGDYAAVYGLEDVRSCAPLSNGDFIELVRHFPGISFVRGWIIFVQHPGEAQPLLNLLNVRYVLTDLRDVPPINDSFMASWLGDFTAFRNDEAWPRAFFSNQVVPLSSNEEFIQYLSQHGKHPFIAMAPKDFENEKGIVTLEQQGHPEIIAAEHYQLGVNSTAFDVKTTSAGMACLTEEQARDFTATANGMPIKVFTVNRAFKGVYLDKPGYYHIEFCYRPHFWRISCGLFCFSAGIVLFLGAFELILALKQRHQITTETNRRI